MVRLQLFSLLTYSLEERGNHIDSITKLKESTDENESRAYIHMYKPEKTGQDNGREGLLHRSIQTGQ